jgi:hypothetical protein
MDPSAKDYQNLRIAPSGPPAFNVVVAPLPKRLHEGEMRVNVISREDPVRPAFFDEVDSANCKCASPASPA